MTNSDSDSRPIFIVGAPRSGTTMMRYMLCGHPRIFIPPESTFIPRLFRNHPENEMTRRQAVRVLTRMQRYRVFWRDWRDEPLVPDRFVSSLPDLKPATLLGGVWSKYARQYGAERWGDKSPINVSYIDLIAEIFPSAKFIHMIRDGRDVALSMKEAYPRRKHFLDAYLVARSWKRRILEARASANRLAPGRYYQLRYEDLVAAPEPLLKEICDFIGESYHPRMSEPNITAVKHYHSSGIHARTREPVSTGRVGRWRTEMSRRDLREFQTGAGDLLKELGYCTEDLGPMSRLELARLCWLQSKNTFTEVARRAVVGSRLFHPTKLIPKWPRFLSQKSAH